MRTLPSHTFKHREPIFFYLWIDVNKRARSFSDVFFEYRGDALH